jgi:hypothetical protein
MLLEPRKITDILDLFTSEDIADILYSLRLPDSGNKADRISRLLKIGTLPEEMLHQFNAEALRGACGVLGVPTGRKADMVAALLGSKEIAPAIEASPPVERKVATREAVIEILRSAVVPRREARVESDAEVYLANILDRSFAQIALQYSIGGYLGTKIDIDLGDGKVGIEVKLSSSLSKSTEVHRMLGQAFHYDRRRYRGNLIVAVVGSSEDFLNPLLMEMAELLNSLGITCTFVTASG